MFAGLDFGTSNSAIGVIHNDVPRLLPLEGNVPYLPSTLFTPDRCFISDYLFRHLPTNTTEAYKNSRIRQLQKAQALRREWDLTEQDPVYFFGQCAIDEYIAHPDDGIFIKSPKSFLGSTGLSTSQIELFEDLVTAMLLNIKQQAEQTLKKSIDKVVIGRPVNYQGIDSEKSNQQALAIMNTAAQRCGYRQIEFLYEPLAAGIDFETQLAENKIVLVVDIGGGTSDCSMVKMGPDYRQKPDRSVHFLAHTGMRVGGNDLDIAVTFHRLMPLFGLGSRLRNGMELPKALYWNASCINHVGEQSYFASDDYVRDIQSLRQDIDDDTPLSRLLKLQQHRLNHRLVRDAESSKIALSDQSEYKIKLDYIDNVLSQPITISQFEAAITRSLNQVGELISEAIVQAATLPDLVYITGGSAKSPTVRALVNRILPDIKILDGDYYGSVAAGLTKWAQKIWR